VSTKQFAPKERKHSALAAEKSKVSKWFAPGSSTDALTIQNSSLPYIENQVVSPTIRGARGSRGGSIEQIHNLKKSKSRGQS
jgi:hypothetical protein